MMIEPEDFGVKHIVEHVIREEWVAYGNHTHKEEESDPGEARLRHFGNGAKHEQVEPKQARHEEAVHKCRARAVIIYEMLQDLGNLQKSGMG